MADAAVYVQLLGGFSVLIDGRLIELGSFPRRSGATLVQFLALSPGRRRHREQVFDGLWPDSSTETAAKRLYQAASYARKALGGSETIVLKGEVVALLPDAVVTVDASVIESADLGDPDGITSALSHWRGELLPDIPYDEWAIEARDRLQRRYLDLLRATERWQTLIEIDPTDEPAHIALMTQSIQLGDPLAALTQFESLEQILVDTIAGSPGVAAIAMRDKAEAALTKQQAPSDAASIEGLRGVAAVTVERTATGHSGSEATDSGIWPILTKTFERFDGTVVDSDDSRLVLVYRSPAEAIAASVAALREIDRIAAASGSANQPSVVRIGIDVGEVQRSSNSWSGRALNRVATIAAIASPDQILCSSVAAELAAPDLEDGIGVVDLGMFQISDLPPIAIKKVTADGIEDRDTGLGASRIGGNPIPVDVGTMIGRLAEAETVKTELEQSRLVSIVGPGGIGKTHLACAVGADLRDSYPYGAWLAKLGTVRDAQGVTAEILFSVGGQRHTDATVTESIVRTLGERASLLILDNCEHQIETIRDLCQRVLARCPDVRILATTREPIGLQPETVVTLEALDRASAVELFRTAARRKGADIDRGDPAIGRICRRLDDLPLALQLAAARVRALDLATIEELLDDRLDTFKQLDGEDGRHSSLRSAIAWSVDALPPGPLDMLIALSVLADRFSLDAAVTVAGRLDRTKGQLLDDFDELVRRSLIVGPDRTASGRSYRLLECVRLYARELSTDSGAADRHLAYFIERSEESDALLRDHPDEALQRFDLDWDDIRQAKGHAAAQADDEELVRLLACISSAATIGLKHEFFQWCEDIWAAGLPAPITRSHARAMGGWATQLGLRGNHSEALRIAKLAYAVNPDDDIVLWAMGWNHLFGHDDAGSWRRYFEELAEDRQRLAGTWRGGALFLLTGLTVFEGGDTDPLIHRLKVLASNGGTLYRASLNQALGYTVILTDPPSAIRYFEEAIEITERRGLQFALMGAHQTTCSAASMVQNLRDALLRIRPTLLWLSEAGLWAMAFDAVLAATRVLQRAGRLDITATLLSVPAASLGVSESLVTSRLESIRKAEPDKFDSWQAAGQALDVPAAVHLTVATIDAMLQEREAVV